MTSLPPRRPGIDAFAALAKFGESLPATLRLRLFEKIESGPILREVAANRGSFEPLISALEQHLVPAAIELGEAQRSLYGLLLAVNLREMASALHQRPLLAALARGGQLSLALGLAKSLPTASEQIRARAWILSSLPRAHPRWDVLKAELAESVRPWQESAPEADAAEAARRAETYAALARELPAEFQGSLPNWLARLAPWPAQAEEVALAFAAGFLAQGKRTARGLWEALAQVQNLDRLAALAPALLEGENLEGQLPRLLALPAARPERLWPPVLEAVGSSAKGGSASAALALAEARLGPLSLDLGTIAAGAKLWPRLPREKLAELQARSLEAIAPVALAVTALEAGAREEAFPDLEVELEAVGDDRGWLHWTARLWRARLAKGLAPAQARAPARRLCHGAAALAYQLGSGDLARVLDLVALAEPRALRRELERALWSPHIGSSGLLRLAAGAGTARLLTELLARAEVYAATVEADEGRAFELRKELISLTARRLCRMKEDLSPLEGLSGRLLVEEEAELRHLLVADLAEAGLPALAAQVGSGLEAENDRLEAHLRVLGGQPPDPEQVEPGALYRAVASSAEELDEVAALAALREEPRDPEEVADTFLSAIRRPARRIAGLVDLAGSSLAWQSRHLPQGRRDPRAAVLPLKAALGVVESDRWLLAALPELVELGARLGPPFLTVEFQEAIERTLRLESVPLEERLEAVEAVLARLPAALAWLLEDRPRSKAAPCRAAAQVLSWLVELAPGVPLDGLPEAVEPGRRELVELAGAVLERLPRQVHRFLEQPGRARLCFGVLAPLCQALGEDRVWDLTQKLWPTRPRGASWGEPAPDETEPRALPTATAVAPGVRARGRRLGRRAPEELPALLWPLALPERAAVLRSWIRGGWLEPAGAAPCLELLAEQDRPAARLELSPEPLPGEGPGAWLASLALLIARGEADPDDPGTAPWRRWLWRLDPALTWPSLAQAALRALENGGAPAGRWALRWLLQVLAGPARPGPGPGPTERCRQALSRARSLEPQAQLEPPPPAAAALQATHLRRLRVRKALGEAALRSRRNPALLDPERVGFLAAVFAGLWGGMLELVALGEPNELSQPRLGSPRVSIAAGLALLATVVAFDAVLLRSFLRKARPSPGPAPVRAGPASPFQGARWAPWLGSSRALVLLLTVTLLGVGLALGLCFAGATSPAHRLARHGLLLALRLAGCWALCRALSREARTARLPGWVRWLHLLPGFAFLLPTPAWPFFVLLGLPLAEAFHWPWRHAPESLAGGPFGVGERRLRWPALEAEIAREQASLPWWQRLGSNANDLLRSRGRGRVEHEIAWAIRLRLLALPFDVAFLLAGAGTASRLLQAQPAALQLGQGAALGLGCAAVVAAGLLRLPRATRPGWGELGVLARQLGRSLLGLALGLGLAEALLLEDPRRATDVLETAALVGGLYLLASWVGSLLPPLPGDSREDDRLVIFWVGLVVLSAALGRGLESQGELGSRSWLLLLALVRWLPAWFMVTMALAVRSLFHPLPTTALRSRKLARSTRLVLFGVLLTAVAPLGGLAAPAWVWLRRHRWPLWWRQCQEASEPLSP